MAVLFPRKWSVTDPSSVCGVIIRHPLKDGSKIDKGAVILSDVDRICKRFPDIRKHFYIIERRAWKGVNESKMADIKLVEDLSTFKRTSKRFPNTILLKIGPADFVDTDCFKPLGIKKEYDGIQISCWDSYKRHELFVKGAALIKDRRFLKFGHFVTDTKPQKGKVLLKKRILELSRKLGANIVYPFASARTNYDLSFSKEEMNLFINKCKVGILTTKTEGINRFKMECLSADIPVILPRDASFPTRKHINESTGLLFDPNPKGLVSALDYVFKNREKFRPRDYILKNTGHKNALNQLKNALMSLCKRDGSRYHFDDIYWDGRNETISWGNDIYALIKGFICP